MSSSLAELVAGESATITGYTEDNATTQRLMQLGVIEGETITLIRRAPAGDPIEISVLNYALSLRRAEASLVLIEKMPVA